MTSKVLTMLIVVATIFMWGWTDFDVVAQATDSNDSVLPLNIDSVLEPLHNDLPAFRPHETHPPIRVSAVQYGHNEHQLEHYYDSAQIVCFELQQNYPNPCAFGSKTYIGYCLPHDCQVKLEMFDLLGRTTGVIVDTLQCSGIHEVCVDLAGLRSGIYFYRLTTQSFIGDSLDVIYDKTKKMMILNQ